MHKTKQYLDNYWSLFEEFVQEFKELKYQSIPLPLLANFYRLIDEEMMDEMFSKDFKQHLKYTVVERKIQPTFEKYLKPLYKHPNKFKLEGTILVNIRYLKFNESAYERCFDKDNSILFFNNGYPKESLGYKAHSVYEHWIEREEEIKEIADHLIRQCEDLFYRHQYHRAFGNTFFKEEFMKLIPDMVKTIIGINGYFDKHPTACIVVGTTEDLLSRTLAVVGGQRGIPSICLQHGLITGEEAYLPVFATKIGVYGFSDRDLLASKGVKRKKIVRMGHPRFDELYLSQHATREELCEQYDLDPDKKIIFVASQPFAPTYWDEFIDGIKEKQDVQIIIKPHPIELGRKTYDHYVEVASRHNGVRVVTDRKAKLYDIIANADLGVIRSSTVGNEIMQFNKPLCVLKNDTYDYYEGLGHLTFSESEPLIHFVDRILSDQQAYQLALNTCRNFIDYAYPKINSSQRLRKLIKEVCNWY